jgi:hypothetical protein
MSQLKWQKSSFSEGGTETCVEVAADLTGTRRHLRESDDPAMVVTTSPAALRALIVSIKAGEFDGIAAA